MMSIKVRNCYVWQELVTEHIKLHVKDTHFQIHVSDERHWHHCNMSVIWFHLQAFGRTLFSYRRIKFHKPALQINTRLWILILQ